MPTPTGLLGNASFVTVGIQTDAVTPNTTARQALAIYKIDGGESETMPDDNVLAAVQNNAEDPTQPAPGLTSHALTVEVPVCSAQFPFWLKAFFGAPVESGTTPNWVNTFASGPMPPWVTIEHQLASNDLRQHIGCMGEELTIDWSAEREGFAVATLKFMGVQEVPLTAASAGTVTAPPALDRPAQALTNVIYNGVSGGALIGGQITLKRNLKQFRSADGTGIPYSVDRASRSTLSGKIATRYEDTTFQADANAKTVRTLAIELMATSNNGIHFDLQNIRLERTPLSVNGPDAVMLDLNFKAWQDATHAAFKAIAKGATQHYVL